MAHDEPDFSGWCNRLRPRLGRLYPAEVRLASAEAALLEALADVEEMLLGLARALGEKHTS